MSLLINQFFLLRMRVCVVGGSTKPLNRTENFFIHKWNQEKKYSLFENQECNFGFLKFFTILNISVWKGIEILLMAYKQKCSEAYI